MERRPKARRRAPLVRIVVYALLSAGLVTTLLSLLVVSLVKPVDGCRLSSSARAADGQDNDPVNVARVAFSGITNGSQDAVDYVCWVPLLRQIVEDVGERSPEQKGSLNWALWSYRYLPSENYRDGMRRGFIQSFAERVKGVPLVFSEWKVVEDDPDHVSVLAVNRNKKAAILFNLLREEGILYVADFSVVPGAEAAAQASLPSAEVRSL